MIGRSRMGSADYLRTCCDSTEAQWHSRPCTVNGPTGPAYENRWSGTHEPSEELHPTNVPMVFARHMRLMPLESCVYEGEMDWLRAQQVRGYEQAITNPNPPSLAERMYFADGQTVIKREAGFSTGPGRVYWGPDQLRVKEDTASSDRTFENETRLH